MTRPRLPSIAPLLAALLVVAGCAGMDIETSSPVDDKKRDAYRRGSVLGGDGGFTLLGPDRADEESGGGTGIAVNSFLWRASLDTLSFLPITSADPFGGVILTDWYTPPEAPDERFKVNLYILDRQLRADGIRASVFRQRRAGTDWRDIAVEDDTATKLEDSILTRARQLRVRQQQRAS